MTKKISPETKRVVDQRLQELRDQRLQTPVDPNRQCPNCGFPETKDGHKYKGLYTPGKMCPHCGLVEKVKTDKEALEELKRDYVKSVHDEISKGKDTASNPVNDLMKMMLVNKLVGEAFDAGWKAREATPTAPQPIRQAPPAKKAK